jgi:hypothetical protein
VTTRHYFKRAFAPAPKPPKVKRPDHKGKNVLVEMTPGHWQAMRSSDYAQLIGRSKGGLTAQARGTAYKWTSEQATKAIKKCWKTKWGKGSRIGVRLGRPAKLRPAVDRVALREYYSIHTVKGISYNPIAASWNVGGGWTSIPRVISEVQALRRLGHLAGMHARIPQGKPIPTVGKPHASSKTTKEQA